MPVVPTHLDGLFDRKQAQKIWARPGHVKVSIGEPVRFGEAAAAQDITRELERRVASLDPSPAPQGV